MEIFPKFLGAFLILASLSVCLAEETPQGKRPVRALPSVSNDHYSEVLADGTYKYAYTGEHRYVAERRLADGTVEGESLYIRPDGVPVKVHYFADGQGYRPKSEVLYKERLVSTRRVTPVQTVREVVLPAPSPSFVLAPPVEDKSINVNQGEFRSRSNQGVNVNARGGDVAVAVPSVTAIVGPGGRAVIRPEAIARTSGSGSRYFRTSSDSGNVAIANPQTTAIIGPGGSVVVEPKAAAYVGGDEHETREVHYHHTKPVYTERVIERHVPVVQEVVRTVPVPVPVPARAVPVHTSGYVYAQPPPPAVHAIHAVDPARNVLIVPPSSRYSYSYGYNAPDPKHPQRDNSAYVNVQVNQ